ncbi:MAG: thioredoxin [Clostridia bacterium]|nr:thioredoxin [Clostridia bacterium]
MITKINEQEFQTKVMNEPAAVVDFSATWCGPCRMLAPVLEQLSEELGSKVKFYNVDVDDDGALAAGFFISSVPTVLLLKNGKVVDRSIGFQPGPAMKSWIEKNL